MTGTPSVVANEVFSAAASILRDVNPVDLFAKHRSLSELTKTLLAQECAAFGIEGGVTGELRSARRSHRLSRTGRWFGYRSAPRGRASSPLFAARNRSVSAWGPLYLSHHDVWAAVTRLKNIMEQRTLESPRIPKRLHLVD